MFVPQIQLQVEATNIFNEPIVETFDLVQNGSTATYITNISKDFDVVTKMNWVLEYTDTSNDWTNFAAGAALTNGIYINYSTVGNMIDGNITNNYELMGLAFNAEHFQDERSPKGNIIWIQHLLTSFIDGGVRIDNTHTIQVWIQDDLTDASYNIESFTVTLKGFKEVRHSYFYSDEFFYPNSQNRMLLQDIEVGQNYNLKINSSTVETLDWINTTTKTSEVTVLFFVPTDQQDSIIHLWLFRDNAFLERHDLIIQPVNFDIIDTFLSFIPYIAIGIAGIFIFVIITGQAPKIRRK